LNAAGAVLGQFPQWSYEQSQLQMSNGDTLLMFTDGLVEACNGKDEFFGEEKLVRIARENPARNASDLKDLLIGAASRHCGEHFQDDASLIVLRRSK
jgi:serine phosphatase RsbU (regulator of sigma subunit)